MTEDHMKGINSIGRSDSGGQEKRGAHSYAPAQGHNSRQHVTEKLHHLRSLHANQESTCFAELVWEPDEDAVPKDEVDDATGTVYASFLDGSEYTYEMTRAEFQDWRDDPSLGEYFNFFVR